MKEKPGIFYIAIIIGWAFITVIFGYGLIQMGIHEGWTSIICLALFWGGFFYVAKNER